MKTTSSMSTSATDDPLATRPSASAVATLLLPDAMGPMTTTSEATGGVSRLVARRPTDPSRRRTRHRREAPSIHCCIEPSKGQSPLVKRAAMVEIPAHAPRTTRSG